MHLHRALRSIQSHGRERKGQKRGRVVGENKRVRGPVSECEREREKRKRRVKTVRKKERESCHGAQEPLL